MSRFRFSRILARAIAGIIFVFSMSSPTLAATTFFGSRTAGVLTATYSITTDDTLGVLALSNITSYSVDITDGTNSVSFTNPPCFFCLTGGALSSTGTDLLFDYGLSGTNYLILYATGGASFICFETSGCVGGPPSQNNITMAGISTQQSFQQGLQSIASIAVESGVPEPSTWAMMLFGFGAIGVSMRRQRRTRNLLQVA